jgi:hypothetical protein
MALLTGQNVCDTVAFRIANRLPANGTGAGSIIECANLALGLISSAASWTWDQTSGTVSLSGDAVVLSGADTGKEFAFFNSADNGLTGNRIERARTSDTLAASTGYFGASSTTKYNTYRVGADSSGFTYDPYIIFYPQLGQSGNTFVWGIWNLTPPVLVYGANPTVRWTVKSMDQLLIDLTEAYVKKILGMAGWDTTWSDCIKRIGDFRITFSEQRENTGPDIEGDIAAKEKQAGRD